ncbi:MAG: DUF4397 domain-containing protein [Salinibacterium sp.]|nr:DUF4397 domain-containing protein [Salinibacterium sp.]
MHKKILAGLAVGFIAAVGIAVPAQAAPFVSSAANADVAVLHAVPGLGVDVDVYVVAANTAGPLGAPAIADFVEGTLLENVPLPAATYDIYVFPADAPTADLATAAITATDVVVPANTSITVVAHLDADGDPVLTPFVNDVSKIPAGQGRLTVRHTAEAPAVDILANGAVAFANVTNPQEGKTLLPVGTIEARVNLEGTATTAIGPADVVIKDGVNTIVYAVSGADGLTVAVQEITGLHSSPSGVNSGQAGLAADPNPALLGLGAAGVLALQAAAAVTVFRVRAARTEG